ncbi:MAG: ATP-binding cassette domain-containing protein [Cloacibacillus evryensis]
MIEIKDLKVNFGEQEVLRGIDWFITPKSRIGLVGDNGAGKTTLLRVLAGSADYEGTITMPKGHSVGYLPQDLVRSGSPLAEYLKGRAGLTEISQRLAECEQRMSALAEDDPSVKGLLSDTSGCRGFLNRRAASALTSRPSRCSRLGFAPERDAARLTSEFSGGWKMRIALAALLLSHSDIMLLDEPTNHLDTESMEWLESWLRDYRGTIIAGLA